MKFRQIINELEEANTEAVSALGRVLTLISMAKANAKRQGESITLEMLQQAEDELKQFMDSE